LRHFTRTGSRQIAALISISTTLGGVAALLLMLVAGIPGPAAQAQTTSVTAFPDLKAIVLSEVDMPGYAADPARTAAQERPDGSVSYDAVFVRNAGAGPGPSEVRLAAARTASGKMSAQALGATRDALLAAGWSARAVPPLGDEAIGLEASGVPVGGSSNAGYGYVFRFGRHLVGTVLSGPSASTSFDQALGYAVQMSSRLDAMLAQVPVPDPDPLPAAAVAPAPPAVAASSASAAPPPATTANAASSSASTSSGTESPRTRPDQSTDGSAAAALPPSTRPAVSVATVLADVQLDDAPELQNGFKLGGFSGLIAPDPSGTSFITVTDRGPNGEIKVDGKKEQVFPLPSFTPRVVKLRLENGRLKVVDTILLRLPEGYTDPITHTRELTGLPSFEGSGEEAYSPDGKTAYGTDPNGVDTEGIALDPRDGSYWLADEYGPSIVHVAADGTLLMRITPRGLGLSTPGVSARELLPEAFKLRKANRGFEGIAISPDGSRLFAILQSPLLNPDKQSGEASRNVRIAVFDSTNGDDPKLAGVYIYQTQKAADVGATTQDDIKIGDIAAISGSRILVAERDSVEGGPHKKVYLVDLAGATDISARDQVSGRTVEQASDADLSKTGIKPVEKSMAVDLAKLGFSPDKFEGLALVDPTTIAVVNDNDFGVSAIDSRGRVVRSGAMPRLVVIRVPEPLQ
jgi:hypothetical protein